MRRSVATAALLALSMVALPAGGAPDVTPGEIARLIAAGDYTAAQSAAGALLEPRSARIIRTWRSISTRRPWC